MTLRENAIQSVRVSKRATCDNTSCTTCGNIYRVVANGKPLTAYTDSRKEAHRQARHWRAILQGMIPSGQQSSR